MSLHVMGALRVFDGPGTASSMVGRAFTLRYILAREDLNPINVFQDPAHPRRVAIETCPPGAVHVIDSRRNVRAAAADPAEPTRIPSCPGLLQGYPNSRAGHRRRAATTA